jgi:hypothetical protein
LIRGKRRSLAGDTDPVARDWQKQRENGSQIALVVARISWDVREQKLDTSCWAGRSAPECQGMAPCPFRRLPQGRDVLRRSGDREVVPQPVGLRQRERVPRPARSLLSPACEPRRASRSPSEIQQLGRAGGHGFSGAPQVKAGPR